MEYHIVHIILVLATSRCGVCVCEHVHACVRVYGCIGVRGGGEVQLHHGQNTYQRFRLLLGVAVCVCVSERRGWSRIDMNAV